MEHPQIYKSAAQADAISFLKSDHAAVKDLFMQFNLLAEASAPAHENKRVIALKICAALTVHTQIEEEIFYPEVRAALGPKEGLMIDQAEVEHASCKALIEQIELMQPSDDHYDAKVIVLGEYIDHHVEEEEDFMFRKVGRAKFDSASLAQELAIRKQELLNDYSSQKKSLSAAVFA